MKFVFFVIFVLMLVACRATVEPLPVTIVPTALPTLVSATLPMSQITRQPTGTPTRSPRERISRSNASQLHEIKRIELRRGQFGQIVWYPDSTQFALAATRGITLFVASTFSATTFIPADAAYPADISPDGKYLAYLTRDQLLHRLNLETRQETIRDISPLYAAYELEFSPDGQELALATASSVIFYDSESLDEVARVSMNGSVMSFAYAPDGRTVAAGEGWGQIMAWERAKLKTRLDHTLDDASLALVFSQPDRLISADRAGTVHTWDTLTGKQIHEWRASKENIHKLALSPDGTLLAAGEDWRVHIFDMASEKQLYEIGVSGLYDIAFSPDGTLFAVLTQDRYAAFYAVE